jgi:methionyl-tRNA formyltransferase
MNKLRIVFMGTPEFAVGILDSIVQNKYEVVGVVTVADKPAGRGQKVKFSAVKEYALQKNLKLLQPTNLKDETFLEELKNLNANLQVVVAFRMLPEVVWKMPSLGTFNLHASLLPEYRGAAPINWAIINGENKTGVTTFFIDDKIDTGEIILSKEIDIDVNENAQQLHDKLIELGKSAVIDTLQSIENNTVVTKTQPQTDNLKTAYKLNKDNCKIDWTKSGIEIYNLIRGLSPYPCAWCYFEDNDTIQNIKIYKATFKPEAHNNIIGSIETTKNTINVAVIDGIISLENLQFPGKTNY